MSGTFPLGSIVAVAVGAALGGCLRWQVGEWLNTRWAVLPLGTLLVNCLGGLLIGAAMATFQRWPSDMARLFFVTGVLGGMTTFSSFSAESLGLLQRGEWAVAALHSAAHVVGALSCAAIGYWLLRALLRG